MRLLDPQTNAYNYLRFSNKTDHWTTPEISKPEDYIELEFGHLEPSEICALNIDTFSRNLLINKKKQPATVRNILELLRRICNYGVKKNLCQGLSFVIEMPTVNNEKTEDLTASQYKALLKAIEKDDHHQAGYMILLALYLYFQIFLLN